MFRRVMLKCNDEEQLLPWPCLSNRVRAVAEQCQAALGLEGLYWVLAFVQKDGKCCVKGSTAS